VQRARRPPTSKPVARRKISTKPVTRAEFDALSRHVRVLQAQFRRMSELQPQLETVKRVVAGLAERMSAIAASVAGITPETR
jgi:hypothetical protein